MTFIKGPAAVEDPPVSAAEVEEAQPAQTDPAVSAPANMDEEVRNQGGGNEKKTLPKNPAQKS